MMVPSDLPRFTRETLDEPQSVANWLTAAREDGAVAFIDKPEDWTSFDCVAKLRNTVGVRRVGHAGTLDPLATGLLIVCFGKGTKQVNTFQEQDKVYDVDVKLGATTPTDDRGSEEVITNNVSERTTEEITAALQTFIGTLTQIAPDYSAIRVQGERQYDRARKGKPMIKVPRIVEVHEISNVTVHWPMVSFTVACSKGTYIRSIARDLGEKLGTGGYVWTLRRTAIGNHRVDDAAPLMDAVTALQPEMV